MYKYIHTCIYIHIYMSAHIHTYTYMHTHIQNVHMKRTQARLERRRGSERARSRCRPRKLCTSLSFDAINPHFAPPTLLLRIHRPWSENKDSGNPISQTCVRLSRKSRSHSVPQCQSHRRRTRDSISTATLALLSSSQLQHSGLSISHRPQVGV